jgi:hypothetical protein
MKAEYVLVLSALLWCLLVGSPLAEPLQGSSENKAIDNRIIPDEKAAPVVTVPFGAIVPPSESSIQNTTKSNENDDTAFTLPSGPKASELIGGVRDPTKLDDQNVPLVIKLPGGAIVSPSGELVNAQNATNSTPVTTNNEPTTFASVFFLSTTAIGALTALVWWRKRKTKRQKKSIRRQSSYDLYGRRV